MAGGKGSIQISPAGTSTATIVGSVRGTRSGSVAQARASRCAAPCKNAPATTDPRLYTSIKLVATPACRRLSRQYSKRLPESPPEKG